MTAERRPRYVSSTAHVLATWDTPESMPAMQPWHDSRNAVTHEAKHGGVICCINEDAQTAPLRSVLRWTCSSCAELYALVRRLGLPQTSVADKCPYFKLAMANPGVAVRLNGDLERHLEAKESGILSIPHVSNRRRPKFRTQAPGPGFIFLANAALSWWLLTASFY